MTRRERKGLSIVLTPRILRDKLEIPEPIRHVAQTRWLPKEVRRKTICNGDEFRMLPVSWALGL